jgi:hypothetical protein
MDVGASMLGRPTLAGVLTALAPLLEPLCMPDGPDVRLGRAAVLDMRDLADWMSHPEAGVDVLLLLGIRGDEVVDLVKPLAGSGVKAVLVKTDSPPADFRHKHGDLGIAVLAVHPDARWAHVHSMVERVLRAGALATVDHGIEALGAQSDLFSLANTIAELVNGLVSIDDEEGRTLAFSPLDESADEIRVLSILGRKPPPGHLEELRLRGFLEKAIHARGVSVLEAKESFRRRLCVSMRDATDRFLGLMWVQERDTGFSEDAAEIIESAGHFAARLVSNSRLIPQFQVEYVRQLIGLPISPAPYDAFGLQLTLRAGTAISVAGFAPAADADQTILQARHAIDLINFYATTFTEDALIATVGERVYVVNPNMRAPEGMRSWTGRVADILTRRLGSPICVGISDAVVHLSDIAGARADVDRILDVIGQRGDGGVATLADLRTPVLLQDVVTHLRARPDLQDPRINDLIDYDQLHDGALVASLQAFLLNAGDIHAAAESLHVHVNTLRYRIRRIRELTDLDLRDPSTRFLTELNVRTWI